MNRDDFTEAYKQGRRDFASENFSGANLRGAKLKEANLSNVNFEGANLSGANLSGANLERVKLIQTYLKGANLRGANLSGANLEGAKLSGANLEKANLSGANLERSNLEGANLKGADLQKADLFRANLRKADLRGANLSGADLFKANLRGANLANVNLQNANINGIRLDSSTQFYNEVYFQDTDGQFNQLQGGIAPINEELLHKLSQKWVHFSIKTNEQLLLELIHFCQSNPESRQAQTFYQHAPWTKVQCTLLDGSSIDAYIPFGTAVGDDDHLRVVHGPDRICHAKVNSEFWADNNYQSDETHFVRLVPYGNEGCAACVVELKALQAMPQDIQQALREAVANPKKHRKTMIRGVSIYELLPSSSWTEEDHQSLGMSAPEVVADQAAGGQAQDRGLPNDRFKDHSVFNASPTSDESNADDPSPPSDSVARRR